MSVEIIIPHVGETTTTVRILNWLKQVGEVVKKGEPVLEVETDKSVIEIEAFADGILAEIVVPAGEEADAMQVVGRIQPLRESFIGSQMESVNAVGDTEHSKEKINASPLAQKLARDLGVSLASVTGSGPNGRIVRKDVRDSAIEKPTPSVDIQATPSARKLATEFGVSLERVQSSRSDGLISLEDVRQYLADHNKQPPIEYSTLRPVSRIRQAIAEKMMLSKQTVPHFYLLVEVDMTLAAELREYCVSTLGWAKKPSYTDLIVRASALAISRSEGVNVSWKDGAVVIHPFVNIGVAVSIEDGLLVPVLKQADQLNLSEVSGQLDMLIDKARQGRLRESDFGEKSLVISNLGMYGMDAFFAIIDPPDPMILAVGRVADQVVAVKGQPAVRPMCKITLSVDHRVLDGAVAARFLHKVKMLLEKPLELL